MLNITPISENAIACLLPPPAQLSQQRRLWGFADAAQQLTEVFEVVVGMNNVTIFVQQGVYLDALTKTLKKLWHDTQEAHYQGKHIHIPVHYGGEYGEDLYEVATFHGISPQTVIERHTQPIYTVFMMGFQPGFPYLGGLPKNLHTPRRPVPRTRVLAGSVGIGGSQTGVYPFDSPGGWQIIGRTDVALFQAQSHPPTLLSAGDTVQFVIASIEV